MQFQKPEGWLGSVAGKLMAAVGTEKHEWTISLLNVEKEDNVLEIGFGPGIAIQRLTQIVQDGKIIGVDYSEKMLKQASKRNKTAIQNGVVELIQADVHQLPSFDFSFDKVYSVNSIPFWKEPAEALKGIRKVMKDGGIIAITVQPFAKGVTMDTAKETGENVMNYMKAAGFADIRLELKQMKPAPAVCVLGVNKKYG